MVRENALKYHQNNGIGNGKIETIPKVSVKTREELSLAYTPGVAVPCLEIADMEEKVFDYTIKGNTVLVVSDGSAVLGLGNIGCKGSIPVMEGKALLFKIFGGVDAYPIVLDSQDTETIIRTVELISPIAGGINLEDISAPRCFEIETRLSKNLSIPVFHDDQHGTAVVSLGGLMNALKIVGKNIDEVKIVVNGSGAAGIAVTRLMLFAGAKNVILCDTKGAIYDGRTNNMNSMKDEIALATNPDKEKGLLADVIRGADVFIGLSAKGALTYDMVKTMGTKPVIFAMANPDPEIMPDEAKAAGAVIIATGRSDFPNQVNNCLGFPAIFRGLLDVRAMSVTQNMKKAAAEAIASRITANDLDKGKIIPSVYDFEVFAYEAEAVGQQAIADGVARLKPEKDAIFYNMLNILKENRRRFFGEAI
jgi:malate dehydrogenase (oxaloacetate-decarboxylating)